MNPNQRKQAEEELRESEHLLTESQRFGHTGSFRFAMTGDIQWSDGTTRYIRGQGEVVNYAQNGLLCLTGTDQLTGMLPICASCKKIKDDAGYWQVVESYISTHTNSFFSHGLCPDCEAKRYEEPAILTPIKPARHDQPIRPLES